MFVIFSAKDVVNDRNTPRMNLSPLPPFFLIVSGIENAADFEERQLHR